MRARRSTWVFAGQLALPSLLLLSALACAGLSLPGAGPPDAFIAPQGPTRTPFQPLPPTPLTPSPAVELAPTPLPPTLPTTQPTLPAVSVPGRDVFIAPDLPAGLLGGLALPGGFGYTSSAEEAAVVLRAGTGQPVSTWIYVLAASFPTLRQEVAADELRQAWRDVGAGLPGGRPLLVDASTLGMFSALWGSPGPGAVEVHDPAVLLEVAWRRRPGWALLPFEALEPSWKVLLVDGQSPLRKDFDPDAYPLSVSIGLGGDPALVAELLAAAGPDSPAPFVPPTNRASDRLTVVALTGVTALVRATAFTMEQRGVKYPGRDVGDWLRQADITHISNEVPFAKGCPFPDPVQPDLRFCSHPKYIELLQEVGTDVVELTGDHFQDWGDQAMLLTLQMYHERGWLTYGGGEDRAQARQAATFEHNGNRLAFIGCNAKGGGYAQAGPGRPGAVVCGDWLESEIGRLRSEGYLVIATFQHFEYYTYRAQPDQQSDFRAAARAGAVVVSGSQAHQPQALEFVDGAFIHYGLGNLFFDQYEVSPATRQAFIDRHVFYAGRYLGAELLPIVFVDYARPRPMTPGESRELLETIFNASGW